ncbi:hypothetical protein AMECASPLE_033325 [Ameca splendens]|uniref:Uncharacterized protein n=1 Tax=Ameca splendens TaxID=208324 RepID=A0ABV1A4R5_9TELE
MSLKSEEEPQLNTYIMTINSLLPRVATKATAAQQLLHFSRTATGVSDETPVMNPIRFQPSFPERLPVCICDQRQAAIIPCNLPQDGEDEEEHLQKKKSINTL